MCGLVGLISQDPSDHALIDGMNERLRHRGPDSGAVEREGPCSLGHRRLAIIDLSAAGAQPMRNETGDILLVCNGEIYNFRDLRHKLEGLGHRFRSGSDSETLLHLYEEYGEEMLAETNGMFAFVLWDSRRRRLIAAVDRVGKKPLYWAEGPDGRLALASEMKALMPLPWLDRSIDPLAVDRYLALRYVPAPLSMFRGVRKLEPGQILTWQDGRVSLRRWWVPTPREVEPYGPRAVDEFQGLFEDAVRLRLESDVPLGLYLSGGVDSAAVGGAMRRLAPGPRTSFTLSVDYAFDERERARRIAEYLGFGFNPVTVDTSDFALLPSITHFLDEPFGDLVCLPSFLLAREAKKQVTVVLTGDGADEILHGYLHQKVMAAWLKHAGMLRTPGLARLAGAMLGAVPAGLLDRLFDYPDRLGGPEKAKLAGAVAAAGRFGSFYEWMTSCFSPADRTALYRPEWSASLSGQPSLADQADEALAAAAAFPRLGQLGVLDLRMWIPYSTLFRLDKLNMAHAVETRSPFLDFRVVEYALSLADNAKKGHNRNKEILRAVIERIYPPELREKGKQAFYMPVTSRYRTSFRAWAGSLLTRESVEARGIFNWPEIESLLFQLGDDSMLVTRQVTALAMLEQWFRIWVDGASGPVTAETLPAKANFSS